MIIANGPSPLADLHDTKGSRCLVSATGKRRLPSGVRAARVLQAARRYRDRSHAYLWWTPWLGLHLLLHGESHQLGWVVSIPHRHDDVLRVVEHVGHRDSGLVGR